MPIKWKFFRVVAIVQIVFCLLIMASLLYSLYANYKNLDATNFLWISLFEILFTLIFIFTVLNLHILQKNYPDTGFTTNKHTFYILFLIFYCIASISVIAVYFYGIYDTINRYKKGIKDDMGLLVLVIMSVLIFCMLYLLIYSWQLKALIKKNAEQKQLAEIDHFFLKD